MLKLREERGEVENFVFVSDRHINIVDALSTFFPKAHHGACTYHNYMLIIAHHGVYAYHIMEHAHITILFFNFLFLFSHRETIQQNQV